MKDGGQAFPLQRYNDKEKRHEWHPGMSLLEYYAGKVLEGLVANPNLMSTRDFIDIAEGTRGGKYFIQASSLLAQAMIDERERRGKG